MLRYFLVFLLYLAPVPALSGDQDFDCPVGEEGTSQKAQTPSILDAADCSATLTNPDGYVPASASPLYRIPVVFHVLMRDTLGTGAVSDDTLRAQIWRFNADFLAASGAGYNSRIMFSLAALDALGDSTNGIERIVNPVWYDSVRYKSDPTFWFSNYDSVMTATVAWNPEQYFNIYRVADPLRVGTPGYSSFPWLHAGSHVDGVRIATGTVSATAEVPTHEVGHYLGLYHSYTGYAFCDSLGEPSCFRFGSQRHS